MGSGKLTPALTRFWGADRMGAEDLQERFVCRDRLDEDVEKEFSVVAGGRSKCRGRE